MQTTVDILTPSATAVVDFTNISFNKQQREGIPVSGPASVVFGGRVVKAEKISVQL